MNIYRVSDPEFKKYGKVVNISADPFIDAAKCIELPTEGSKYVPTLEVFEALSCRDSVEEECFGSIPAQLGYCWGHNDTLNALEWHSCSELNIAVTDFILLLGDIREIEEGNKYNSANVKAFLVKKGEAIVVYATTLHFCPIETSSDGFGCVVGLLAGTNTNLDKPANDPLLFRKNKWIIAHVDNAPLIARGVIAGIYGENYRITGDQL